MTSTGNGTTFASATAVRALSSHKYETIFMGDWSIGSVPNGGYVTATFIQVASKHFSTTLSSQNQPNTIALHLDFLRRTSEGPALFTVKDTKLGRQASVIHITLSQEGREEIIGSITQGNIADEEGVTFTTDYALHPAPLPVNLALLPTEQDEHWTTAPPLAFPEFRKATQKTLFYLPRAGQQKTSSADEWVKLATGEKWTNASIGYLADTWPNPVEAFIGAANSSNVKNQKEGKGGALPSKLWYPTLLLNLEMKKSLPEEGVEWLFLRVDSKQIKQGRLDLEIVILDEGGDIVALSHQIAFAVSAERNLAARRIGATKI